MASMAWSSARWRRLLMIILLLLLLPVLLVLRFGGLHGNTMRASAVLYRATPCRAML